MGVKDNFIHEECMKELDLLYGETMPIHKYNFENATEKRAADKVMGHILMPDPDGQVKHPEHLEQHEMLQVLQRHALTGNVKECKRMIAELPEHQKKDTILMLKNSVESQGRTINL